MLILCIHNIHIIHNCSLLFVFDLNKFNKYLVLQSIKFSPNLCWCPYSSSRKRETVSSNDENKFLVKLSFSNILSYPPSHVQLDATHQSLALAIHLPILETQGTCHRRIIFPTLPFFLMEKPFFTTLPDAAPMVVSS